MGRRQWGLMGRSDVAEEEAEVEGVGGRKGADSGLPTRQSEWESERHSSCVLLLLLDFAFASLPQGKKTTTTYGGAV